MDIAQPLFEADDRLAAGGEAEVSGLDDAGVNGADRNLVEAFALGRQEWIGKPGRWLRRRLGPESGQYGRERPIISEQRHLNDTGQYGAQ